jgi:predicted component of type VI protein secretion system
MTYYAIPFDPEQAAGKAFGKTDLEASIRQHIRLMLATLPGSYRFSPAFGLGLNKHHYRLPDKRKGEKKLESELKENLQQNLRLLIERYEPRLLLHDIEVKVKFPRAGDIQPQHKGGRIIFDLNLIGFINGRESFQHAESIYLK